MEKIAVLIPCYNEELTIEKVIGDFRKVLPQADIYVYNNNSKDRSVELATKAGAIVRHEKKQGKGNVIRTMFREVEADIYVLVDADDTYPAEAVLPMIQEVRDGADMVVGDRLSNGTYTQENKRKFHNFGNSLVRGSINLLFHGHLQDIMSGYRVFHKRFVKNFPVMTKKFEVETEMTLHALDKNFHIVEVPIQYRDRPQGSTSKLHTVRDGLKVIKTIIKLFKDYRPLRFFTLIAAVIFLLGLIIGAPVLIEFYQTRYITKVPSAVLASALVTLSVIIGQCGAILHTVVKQHKSQYELTLLRYDQIEKLKEKNRGSE